MKDNNFQLKKSIMYKMISLGCSVYIDEWDEFVITMLVCQDCNAFWNKSRTECLYCGTENYHVYKCTGCGRMYSITNASQQCSDNNCTGKLIKRCINPNCISNTNNRFLNYLDGLGGVFNIGSAGSTLNEVHCKNCGGFTSTYKSVRALIVEKPSEVSLKNDNILYIFRNGKDNITAAYNSKKYENKSIHDVLVGVFEIAGEGLLENEEIN